MLIAITTYFISKKFIFKIKKMRTYFNLLAIAAIILLFVSCSKELDESYDVESSVLDKKEESMVDFSKILSRAVYNEEDLRAFLKKEAQKEFDKDHDVFYPWTKNAIIKDGRSFREILLDYDLENKLEAVENNLPLLNILVPDWSWINDKCFSVNSWDLSIKEVGVGYSSKSETRDIYANGKLEASLPVGAFPDFPVLIVKENERMKRVAPATKAELPVYDFIDDEFNASNEIKTKGTVYDTFDLPYSVADNYLGSHLLDGRVRKVYDVLKNNPLIPQRDYIYYNMTPKRDTGMFDFHYKECLYKFKFRTYNIPGIYDDLSGNGNKDIYKIDHTINHRAHYNWLTHQEIIDKAWADGSLEIYFKVFNGSEFHDKLKVVTMKEAFFVKKVFQVKQVNWVGHIQWRYYHTEFSQFEPKWIELNYPLFSWDLQHYPYGYRVEISEKDNSVTRTIVTESTYTYAKNFKSNGGIELKFIKIGYDKGTTETSQERHSTTFTYQEQDDNLANFWVYYKDPIVKVGKNSKSLMYVYTTGAVDLMIIPKYE